MYIAQVKGVSDALCARPAPRCGAGLDPRPMPVIPVWDAP